MIDDGAAAIEIDPSAAMAGTRHLVLLDISRHLLGIEQRIDACDTECDRVLTEMWRLAKWVDSRVERNFGAAGT